MPWTETTRPHYERRCPRYASDLTDAEWALIEPLMPAPNRIGRPRKTDLREVVNALLYVASSGGAWRLLPKDFPPFSTVQKYFWRWRDEGLLRAINNELVMARERKAGRQARPPASSTDGVFGLSLIFWRRCHQGAALRADDKTWSVPWNATSHQEGRSAA